MLSLRCFFLLAMGLAPLCTAAHAQDSRPPNILIAISDDQSFPYASAYGSSTVSTPHFDRVAEEGVLFTNAFVASPGCSPSRAALLTGRYPWQIEHAGTHASYFPAAYVVFPDLLEDAGYAVGFKPAGGIRTANTKVCRDGVTEQERVLKHEGNLVQKVVEWELPDVDAAQSHPTAIDIPESSRESGDS